MKVHTFDFRWAYKTIKNNILTVKYEAVLQTDSLKIENYCKNIYNDLLHRNLQQFSIEQLQRLYKMRQYIRSNFSANDCKQIINYLSQQQWFFDVPCTQEYVTLQIDDYDCKYLPITTSMLPWICISGTLTFNIQKAIEFYIQKQYLKIKETNNRFVKEVVILYFTKPLPKILTADNYLIIKNEILTIITQLVSLKSFLSSLISKHIAINNIHTYKKQVQWEDDYSIKIIINDYVKLLQLKIKKNIIPATLAGAYIYSAYKKNQQLKTAINVYTQVLNVLENLEKEHK